MTVTERTARQVPPGGRPTPGAADPARAVGPADRRSTPLRFAAAVRRALGAAALTVVAVVVVLVPAIGQRLLLVDPLAAPRTRGSRWVTRVRRPVPSGSPRAGDHAAHRLPRNQRWRRGAATPLALVLIAGAAAVVVPRVVGGSGPEVPAAMADAAWWPEYRTTTRWIIDHGFNGLGDPKLRDVRSPHVNVTDGVRRSWVPPPCECRRVRVWMYGGSTTFGMGQRDEHTIASELSRVAWEHGIAVDVENRGVPADIHWVEARSFAWHASGATGPDLAVFYDGVNDIGAEVRGGNGAGQPIDTSARDVDEASRSFRNFFARLFGTRAPDDAWFPPTDDGTAPHREPEEVGRAAVRTYDRARTLSRAVGTQRDIPVRWFWQPAQTDRGEVPGEPISPGADWGARVRSAARDALPEDVVDLTRALDGVPGPVFFDDVHHNEAGARAIAEHMFRAIEQDLERVASG